MMKKLIVKVLIKNAIAFEEASYRFYRSAEEKALLPEHRRLFSFLAEEEVKHREKLNSLMEGDIEEILAFSEQEEVGKLDLPAVEMPHKLEEATTPQKILLLALDKESAAYNFYRLLAERSKIPVVKKVFNFLAREEDKHRSRIKRECEAISP